MRRIPSPRDDGCVTGAVDFLPLRPAILAYVQDGHDADTVRFLPREPGVQSTPSPREDGRVAATVGFYRRDRVCKALLAPEKTVALTLQ